MKAIRILLIAAALLVVAVLISGLIAPKEVEVKRSIKIKAPPAAVYPHIEYIDKMAKWHPWLKKDPNVLTSVVGTDGTQGAVRRWDSENSEVGSGQETILEVEKNAYLKSKVEYSKPRTSEGISQFSLVDYGDNTQVIWQFKYEIPYPWNAFMLFSDPETGMGDYFTDGLKGLKNILERRERGSVNYLMNEYSFKGGTYAIKRQRVSMDDLDDFAQESLDQLTSQRDKAGLLKAGFPIGIFFDWDATTEEVDYAIGMPVAEEGIMEGLEYMSIPSTNKAKTIFINDLYNDRKAAHRSIQRQMTKQGLNIVFPGLEIYMKGALSEFKGEASATRVVYRFE